MACTWPLPKVVVSFRRVLIKSKFKKKTSCWHRLKKSQIIYEDWAFRRLQICFLFLKTVQCAKAASAFLPGSTRVLYLRLLVWSVSPHSRSPSTAVCSSLKLSLGIHERLVPGAMQGWEFCDVQMSKGLIGRGSGSACYRLTSSHKHFKSTQWLT